MSYLRTKIGPLKFEEDELSLVEVFMQELSKSDEVWINVGYASYASLIELEHLVEEYRLKKVKLILGMYYRDAIPQGLYRSALALNQKWKERGIGEIRFVTPFKSHEKLYLFKKNGKVFSALIGSPNLSFICPDSDNRNQFESGDLVEEPSKLKKMMKSFAEFSQEKISTNIAEIKTEKLSFTKQPNLHLMRMSMVKQLTPPEASSYFQRTEETTFILPLKVPSFADRFKDDGHHYTKSNINTGYAKPRNALKSRNWYETQLHVPADIRNMPGYPKKNEPFFVITDDGYQFLAHTTSDSNKQLAAIGNELILGYWLKGRLEAASLVAYVMNTQADIERTGMITKEMLEAYGTDSLVFSKTNQKLKDEQGIERDVWCLSFQPSK